ncbi:RagB/SusD family nutrient uptake outer membrane protein [Sunxiuqinia sp. A32]|uniref:RagB/SusD family nutrient uptake outer membrane protein n=1 Tax=Sunxiuqinia sp. A32 TaxID=3461496 RepID=UPI00404563D6
MKLKITYLAVLFITTVFLQSCEENLVEKPYSSLSAVSVYDSEDNLLKATYGVYQSYTGTNFWAPFSRFLISESGNKYCAMGIFGDGLITPYYKFAQTPTNSGWAAQVWAGLFSTISRANSVISNANDAVSDEAVANIYIAEAKFLRAYAYFVLVRNFGGVPIINKDITSLAETDLIYGARASVEETYNFIVGDLEFAETHLPDKWIGPDLGRISAGTAKAMLGKVYLTMAGKPLSKTEYFQKVVDKLEEVYGSANEDKYGFGLEDNFFDIFSLDNERNKELILSFGYFYNSSYTYGSIFPFFLFPRGLVNGDEQTFYGLTDDFYNLFEQGDTRRDVTMIDRYVFTGASGSDGANPGDSIIYNTSRKQYIIKGTDQAFGNAAVKCGRAYGKLDRTARISGAGPWGYQNDVIELRYADVVLCLAEALVEIGQESQALPLINRIRDRAGASIYATLPTDMRSAVRLERRLELTGEFTTVYDIRRWGTLQDEIAAMVPDQFLDNVVPTYSEKLELYPIPQTQIDANENLLQNPGY